MMLRIQSLFNPGPVHTEVRCGYYSGYTVPTLENNLLDLEREREVLCRWFPSLSGAQFSERFLQQIRYRQIVLPDGAERWTLIPRAEIIAETYEAAVKAVLTVISDSRRGKFSNYRANELGSDVLQHLSETKFRISELSTMQDDFDLLIVPVQFGIRHAGCSMRDTPSMYVENEFGLGIFEVGIMLLTHPERLSHENDLWILCPGDRYTPRSKATRLMTQFAGGYRYEQGLLGFGGFWYSVDNVSYGSVTAFVP